MTYNVDVPNSEKSCYSLLKLLFITTKKDYSVIRVNKGAHPVGKASIKTNT